MRNKFLRRISCIGVLVLMLMSTPVKAIDNSALDIYSQNDIIFYDPTNCEGSSGTPEYDNLIVGKSNSENLENVVREYGELAMDMQREWGTPWEVVFAQMVMESSVGTAGVAVSIYEDNKYYNWLGMTGSGGSNSVGTPYVSGREWAQYASISNMIKDWAGEYIARNGYYDKAFTNNLNPNSFDLRGFLNDFIAVYAPSSDGNNVNSYITIVESYINGTIADIRKEKGWPSSAELAKNENIAIGGKHPIGTKGDENDEESSSVAGKCVLLRNSPDYSSRDYLEKLSHLHDYNQGSGTFKDEKMCGGENYNMAGNGCGIMSLYAAWYMFSSEGYNDENVFRDFVAATRSDGYNACYASAARNFGSNLSAFTDMSGEMLFDGGGDHWDDMVKALESGQKLIILVDGSDGSLFTSGGHYMMLDHYNKEKDMIYLFDPSMYTSKYDKVKSAAGSGVEYFNGDERLNTKADAKSNAELFDSIRDGIYVNRDAMNSTVKPWHALALTYNGCYGGGTSVCRSTSNGLVDGGMTYEQAVEFMKPYAMEAAKEKFGDYGDNTTNGTVIGNGRIYSVGCSHGTLNNCVAFSQWFLGNYTELGPVVGTVNGWDYTNYLINDVSNKLQDGGRIPRAYAIFSTISYNHTGVVLGVNKDKNEVYIGEASCGYYYAPSVHTKSLDEMTNGNYRYAYTDGKLKMGNLNK